MAQNDILICTYSAGYGHHKVSQAIKEALLILDPCAQVHIVDPLKYGRPHVNALMISVYLRLLKRVPFVYRTLYARAEKAERSGRKKLPGDLGWRVIANKSFCHRMDGLVEAFRPTTIICAHPFAAIAVSKWKTWKKADFPAVIGIITDFTIHPFWAGAKLDGYFVASEALLPEMTSRGIAQEKVWPMGIPVGSQFSRPVDKQAVRRRLGLDPCQKTIMVMGGGLGLGELHQVVESIGKSRLPVQVVVVAGVNELLQKRLAGLIKNFNKPIKIYAFVDNVPDLMGASDVIVTKPGGVTVAEAMAARLPMIIWKPIPGQEERNASYLTSRNLACQVSDEAELVETLDRLLDNGLESNLELAVLQRLAARNIAGLLTKIPKRRPRAGG